MKLILTHGYFLNEDPAEQRIMKPYPPLGILYISAYLKENGIENKIFDTTFSSKSELKNYLIDFNTLSLFQVAGCCAFEPDLFK